MNEIKQGENRFYIGESEEERIAEIHFVPTGATQIIVDHTEVSDQLKGTGAGKKLVERIVQYAREENKKVVPLCPFAKAQIEKNEAWHGVLK